MSEIKCQRCHGPATIIDKAPPGESGDIIRCDAEKTCAELTDAAHELESTHEAVIDATQEFVRQVGKPRSRTAEIKIPGYAYAALLDTVQEWKDAGESLIQALCKHAAAQRKTGGGK